jgi:nucleoside-diphosphate-sugar epimerase
VTGPNLQTLNPVVALLFKLLQGKLETEDLLQRSGVNYTSIRPVYIYGPLNYNPVEEFFFHRLKAGRPICVPGSGMQVRLLDLKLVVVLAGMAASM